MKINVVDSNGIKHLWNRVVELVSTKADKKEFIKSGVDSKSGLVPAPPSTAGNSKYLCEDGTWKSITSDGSGGNISIDSELSDTSENPVQNKVICNEINTLKKSVSDSKKDVADAITEMGITTATDASFDTIVNNIKSIQGNTQKVESLPIFMTKATKIIVNAGSGEAYLFSASATAKKLLNPSVTWNNGVTDCTNLMFNSKNVLFILRNKLPVKPSTYTIRNLNYYILMRNYVGASTSSFDSTTYDDILIPFDVAYSVEKQFSVEVNGRVYTGIITYRDDDDEDTVRIQMTGGWWFCGELFYVIK